MVDTIHIDQHILVLNKPAGIPVLPDGWDKDAPFLLQMLASEYGRLWVVHRLDKVTSGAMVFARSAEAHRAMNIQFERHLVRKAYHGIAAGAPAWDEKDVRQALRLNVGHRHRSVPDARRGKPSRTTFRVLRRGQQHVLLEAEPITGRTHQVRAHAFAAGLPLLGDLLYGGQASDIIGRPALHARSLRLRMPVHGDWAVPANAQSGGEWVEQTFSAEYPLDFQAALDRLWPLPMTA